MLKLQGTFIKNAPEEILVYGINEIFFNEVEKKLHSKGISYSDIGRLFGLQGKYPNKNLWSWKKGGVGISLRAINKLSENSMTLQKELEKNNLLFGERRSKHKVIIPSLNKWISYLSGLISGDGNIQKYFTRIVDEHKENLICVDSILKEQFSLPTKLRKEYDKKWLLEINSRIITEFFNKVLEIPIGSKNKIEIPTLIKESRPEIKHAYIKGWMDAEGSVEQWFKTKDKWYPRICFKVKNKEIWEWITKELQILNIHISKFIDKEESYRFQISRAESINLYFKHIGFFYPTKLNKIKRLITPN